MSNWCLVRILLVMLCFAGRPSLHVQRLLQRSLKLNTRASAATSWETASEASTLVIVESPAKAKTIQKYVDSKTFTIDCSVGHIRDLASGVDQAPTLKDKMVCKELSLKAASLGVDVYDGFKPIYANHPGKAHVIKRLQDQAKRATRIILATDEDREGEAISWHLTEVLAPKVPYKVHHVSRF
jgi:DNA topoisomerase IA